MAIEVYAISADGPVPPNYVEIVESDGGFTVVEPEGPPRQAA